MYIRDVRFIYVQIYAMARNPKQWGPLTQSSLKLELKIKKYIYSNQIDGLYFLLFFNTIEPF